MGRPPLGTFAGEPRLVPLPAGKCERLKLLTQLIRESLGQDGALITSETQRVDEKAPLANLANLVLILTDEILAMQADRKD